MGLLFGAGRDQHAHRRELFGEGRLDRWAGGGHDHRPGVELLGEKSIPPGADHCPGVTSVNDDVDLGRAEALKETSWCNIPWLNPPSSDAR